MVDKRLMEPSFLCGAPARNYQNVCKNMKNSTQETNVEPPAKQFRQRLKRKVNQMSVKSAEEDSYCDNDKYVLESTAIRMMQVIIQVTWKDSRSLVTWKWIHPMIFRTGSFNCDILK